MEEEQEEEEDEEKEIESEQDNVNDSSFSTFRTNSSNEVNSFLETEPIENLEQDLESSHSFSQKENEEETIVHNAPEYDYSSTSYDSRPTRSADTQVDVSGGALTTHHETITNINPRPDLNFRSWQESHTEMGAQSRGMEDQLGEARKVGSEDYLPFQSKDKPKRF